MADPPVPPRFGTVLRRLRTEAGLTQAGLAERAHISQRGLQDLERGIHQAPHRDTLDLLAAALGLSGPDHVAFLSTAQAQSRTLPAPLSPRAPVVPDALAPLVGRAGELALLDRFLAGEDAPAAATRVLLLAGEPGIGKTRLLQAAAQQAVPRGWCVLFGGCQRRGGEDPYAPLLAALAQHIALRPPAQRGNDLAGCAWLVRLLPELAEVLEPLPAARPAAEQERRLTHAAVARFLSNAAGPAGTLLILDDLHWAGPDALDLIDTLARVSSAPIRIVGAYRDTEVRPTAPLGLLLSDLAQARLVSRVPLGPLAAADAAALLQDLLVDTPGGGNLAEGVLRRAGGTPFFLVSYAQALRQGSAEGVPWDLAQGVRQRVALLPEPAPLLLGAAAVIGRQVGRALLLRVSGLAEEALLAGLEAACQARLLLEEGDVAYGFAHDLIRELLEADLGAARRAMLHRRVAEALEGAPEDASPELLAFHYGRGGAWEKTLRYLELAGDRAAAQYANRVAEDHYREALERLERLGREHEAPRVREKLGEVLRQTGRYGAALQVLEQAGETYHAAEDWAGLGRVAASIAEIDAQRGAPDEGIARLQPLLEQLDRGGASAPPAALYLWWGLFLLTLSRYGESLAALERADELARASSDQRTLVRVGWVRADILQRRGQIEEALRANREVLPLAEAMGSLELLVPLHRDLALLYILRGALVTGKRHVDRSLELMEQFEDPAHRSFTLAVRGWLAIVAGDWQSAHADLSQAVALSRQVDRSLYSPYPLTFLARLSLAIGEGATATALVREAIGQSEANGDVQALRWASTTMAESEILEGRPEAAWARLVPLLDRPGLEECDVTALLPVLAWAQLELGHVDEAAETVEQALGRARPEEMRLVLVEALRLRALVALRREQWDEAEGSLAEGLALARAMPYPYAAARLLHLDGLLHTQQGELAAARERLAAARVLFERLGARRDTERTGQDLAGLSQQQTVGTAAQPPPSVPRPSAAPAPAVIETGAVIETTPRDAWTR